LGSPDVDANPTPSVISSIRLQHNKLRRKSRVFHLPGKNTRKNIYAANGAAGLRLLQFLKGNSTSPAGVATQYPTDQQMAYTAADVSQINRSHKIASLVGLEGSHQINKMPNRPMSRLGSMSPRSPGITSASPNGRRRHWQLGRKFIRSLP